MKTRHNTRALRHEGRRWLCYAFVLLGLLLLLPVQARPKSRQKLSMKLSSSSTTTSRPTDLANSVIFFSGRGQIMPSFNTG